MVLNQHFLVILSPDVFTYIEVSWNLSGEIFSHSYFSSQIEGRL